MPPPQQPRPAGLASTPTSSQVGGSFGAIDVNSHEDVLMLLVKLNLCMTACVLGILLFIIGGKVRRWRSARSRRIVGTDWDCASLGSQQPSLSSVKKPGRGGRLWRSWRDKLAASSARVFSEQSKKERELDRDLSESDATQPPLVVAFRPASATIFHWSPAPARAMPMAAPPPSLPPPPPPPQPPPPLQPVTSSTAASHAHHQQLQHQQLQQSYHRSIGLGGCHLPHHRLGFPVTTDDEDEAAAATSASSVASPGAASSSAASSAAALLACRCSNADLRLHNTPASSEFSLDDLLPPPPPRALQGLRSGRLQQQQQQLLPSPLQPPQTPTSESVITDSSC